MATEYSSFAGWERNLKLSNDFVEVIITLEVGPRIISYRPVQGRSVFKRHSEGWAAYVVDDHLFMKSVPFIEGELYPDLGSNFEAFTNTEFLELETIGPLKKLSAGATITHDELWVVFSGVSLPEPRGGEALLTALDTYKQQLFLAGIRPRGCSGSVSPRPLLLCGLIDCPIAHAFEDQAAVSFLSGVAEACAGDVSTCFFCRAGPRLAGAVKG
jgi:hypothetical protein